VAAFIPGFGCSQSTTMIRPDRLPPDQGSVQAQSIAKQLEGKEVTVNLLPPQNSKLTEEEALTGRIDFLDGRYFVLHEAHEKQRQIPFEQTSSFSSNSRAKGALRGLMFGSAAGALVGLIVSSELSGMACSEDPYPSSCSSKGILPFTMLSAVLVGAVGAGIGALIGRRTTLTF